MRNLLKQASIVFTAGCVGGILNRLAVWVYLKFELYSAFGLKFIPVFDEFFIYTGIVWGGLWGFLFLIPFLKKSVLLRGLLYSIPPSIVMLCVVFPFWLDMGMMGSSLGRLMPHAVLVFNIIWSMGAAAWLWIIRAE